MSINLPNAFSLARLPLAFLFAVTDAPAWQALIIVAAGATDFVDGWLARRFALRSRSGELLDPITDKLFVLTVLVVLYARNQIQPGELLLLLSRDIYNTAAFVLARIRRWPLRFSARMSGKVVTVLQIFTVLAYILAPALAPLLLVVTVAASLYAMYDYSRAGILALREARRPG